MALSAQHAADALRLSVQALGVGFRVAADFLLVELQSRCGSDTVLAHPALLILLQRIRRAVGRPVHITSGYRSPAHNAKEGGVPGSLHTKGMAADIKVPGLDPETVARVAERVGAGGIGIYPTFTHVDVGERKRWDKR